MKRLSGTTEQLKRGVEKSKKVHMHASEKKVQEGSFWVWRSNSMQVGGRGPSLGFLGQNSMGNPSLTGNYGSGRVARRIDINFDPKNPYMILNFA